MSNQLQSFMAELEQFGKANDSAVTERARRMLNALACGRCARHRWRGDDH